MHVQALVVLYFGVKVLEDFMASLDEGKNLCNLLRVEKTTGHLLGEIVKDKLEAGGPVVPSADDYNVRTW